MKKVGTNDHESAASGKKYSPPKLVDFGKMRELTTGGSGVPTEKDANDMHPNKRS